MKRATSFGSLDIKRLNISIHALVKRATGLKHFDTVADLNFNPRPREEGDEEHLDTKVFDAISIHALVKRATVGLGTTCA